jgi:hypothetical protein
MKTPRNDTRPAAVERRAYYLFPLLPVWAALALVLPAAVWLLGVACLGFGIARAVRPAPEPAERRVVDRH